MLIFENKHTVGDVKNRSFIRLRQLNGILHDLFFIDRLLQIQTQNFILTNKFRDLYLYDLNVELQLLDVLFSFTLSLLQFHTS